MNTSLHPLSERSRFAAVFLDFENIYYFFKNHFFDPPELNDHVLELLRNLRQKLTEEYGLDCIVLNAYADFERLASTSEAESTPQGALYLLGVDTKNVLGTDHKNAADMRLCIDSLEVLYTRPEIGTFVLVAGDRDYIPVIQHLRRQARRVLGVGFRESVSGDLLLNLGEAQFINARDLIDDQSLTRLEERRREGLREQADRQQRFEEQQLLIQEKASASRFEEYSRANSIVGQQLGVPDPVKKAATEPQFEPVERIEDVDERYCLELILLKLQKLQASHHAGELWLGPFLRQLPDEMPSLADWERRRLLDNIARAGAIRIEKRQGEPYPFSVLLVNYAHPDVVELNP